MTLAANDVSDRFERQAFLGYLDTAQNTQDIADHVVVDHQTLGGDAHVAGMAAGGDANVIGTCERDRGGAVSPFPARLDVRDLGVRGAAQLRSREAVVAADLRGGGLHQRLFGGTHGARARSQVGRQRREAEHHGQARRQHVQPGQAREALRDALSQHAG